MDELDTASSAGRRNSSESLLKSSFRIFNDVPTETNNLTRDSDEGAGDERVRAGSIRFSMIANCRELVVEDETRLALTAWAAPQCRLRVLAV